VYIGFLKKLDNLENREFKWNLVSPPRSHSLLQKLLDALLLLLAWIVVFVSRLLG